MIIITTRIKAVNRRPSLSGSMQKARFGRLLIICFGFYFAVLTPAWSAFEEMITVGGRPQGMAGAFCAIADEPTSILINPAGLLDIKGSGFSFTYSNLYPGLVNDSLGSNFASFVSPLGKNNSLGLCWANFNSAKYNEHLIGLSLGQRFSEHFAIAANLKFLLWDSAATVYFLNQSENLSGAGISVDLGLLYKGNPSWGLVITDINQPNIVSSISLVKDQIPLGVRAGISFSFIGLLWDADFLYRYYAATGILRPAFCLGIEKSFADFPLSLRAGLNFPDMDFSYVLGRDFSLGASYTNKEGFPWGIDYAFIYSSFSESPLITNRVTFNTDIGAWFGPPKEELTEEEKIKLEMQKIMQEIKKLEEKK